MLDNTNGLVVNNYDAGVGIHLGNGLDDAVYDYSTGGNTITVGSGNGDFVYDITGPNDSITLGNGLGDVVADSSAGGNTITLGQGNGDGAFVSGVGDTIALGNGALDQVGLNGGGGDTVTVGNGAGVALGDYSTGGNSITLGNGAGDLVYDPAYLVFGPISLGDAITVGNGPNDVVYELNPIASTVHVGAGAGDTVYLLTGAAGPYISLFLATVTFGGPNATLDFNYIGAGGASFATPTLASQTFVSTSTLDVIKGLTVAGDSIVLNAGNTDTLATTSNLAGVANEAVFAAGTYSALSHIFTESAAGHDALLTFDTGGSNFLSVVLVGAAHDIAGSTIDSGTITLG
jgi:hypothetical protein